MATPHVKISWPENEPRPHVVISRARNGKMRMTVKEAQELGALLVRKTTATREALEALLGATESEVR